MKKIFGNIIGLVLVLIESNSSAGTEVINFDIAVFPSDSGRHSVECYISVPKRMLTYTRDEKGVLRTKLEVKVEFQTVGKLVKEIKNTLSSNAEDTADAVVGQLIHTMSALLKSGNYNIIMSVEEVGGRKIKMIGERKVEIFERAPGKVSLSDIELATSIKKSTRIDGVFYKNTLEVVPNPSMIFGAPFNELHTYIVATNSLQGTKIVKDFYTHSAITRNGDTAVFANMEKRRRRKWISDEVVLTDSYSLESLPSGKYTYQFELTDSTLQVLASRKKIFFVYNPKISLPQADYKTSNSTEGEIIRNMKEDEVEELVRQIAAIDIAESEIMIAMTATERRNKLVDFWAKKSGEFALTKFRDLAIEAKRLYTNSYKQGFETDRGRILIKYGRPDNTDFANSDPTLKPHEIWTYNNIPNNGSGTFIFVDRNGFGSYELIHSTVRGEIYNPNWLQYITPTRSSTIDISR